jgi:hypothetical protein
MQPVSQIPHFLYLVSPDSALNKMSGTLKDEETHNFGRQVLE